MKKDLRNLKEGELLGWMNEVGEPAFRVKQIDNWLWQRGVSDIDEMTNLSLSLREKLRSEFEIKSIKVHSSQISDDGTIKSTYRLYDNRYVEGVLIPTENRMTACVSSQVGCSLACKFCATGFMTRERNLEAGEIYDQVVQIKNEAEQRYNKPLTNIVYMGMGEPLLNYNNVLRSINLVTSPEGLNWSPKRITVSTAGIAKMIKRLGDDQVKFNLALSLHAADDEKRSKIMPINDSNSISSLREALIYFYEKTKTRVTLEYIVFKDLNDQIQDAKNLIHFVKRVPSKVNLIEYNPVEGADFERADPEVMDNFAAYLERHGVTANVRRSRGKDIDAACGQLALKDKEGQ